MHNFSPPSLFMRGVHFDQGEYILASQFVLGEYILASQFVLGEYFLGEYKLATTPVNRMHLMVNMAK